MKIDTALLTAKIKTLVEEYEKTINNYDDRQYINAHAKLTAIQNILNN